MEGNKGERRERRREECLLQRDLYLSQRATVCKQTSHSLEEGEWEWPTFRGLEVGPQKKSVWTPGKSKSGTHRTAGSSRHTTSLSRGWGLAWRKEADSRRKWQRPGQEVSGVLGDLLDNTVLTTQHRSRHNWLKRAGLVLSVLSP